MLASCQMLGKQRPSTLCLISFFLFSFRNDTFSFRLLFCLFLSEPFDYHTAARLLLLQILLNSLSDPISSHTHSNLTHLLLGLNVVRWGGRSLAALYSPHVSFLLLRVSARARSRAHTCSSTLCLSFRCAMRCDREWRLRPTGTKTKIGQ